MHKVILAKEILETKLTLTRDMIPPALPGWREEETHVFWYNE